MKWVSLLFRVILTYQFPHANALALQAGGDVFTCLEKTPVHCGN